MTYAQPKNLDEALGLLADESWSILAGGTDFYPGALERPMPSRIMDIHALDELRQISVEASHVRIGAGATWSDLIAVQMPPAFDALKLAAREVGSVQIQNRATVVGNLCNASPAADGVPPLLILDAAVELVSRSGTRTLPLQEFTLGNRLTARAPSEIVSGILIPHRSTEGQSTFLKLGARKYLVISISMVAGRMVIDHKGIIVDVALSVGSCSLVAQRLNDLEAALTGQAASTNLGALVDTSHLQSLAPIDDVRSTVQYRMDASLELVKRCVNTLGSTLA